MDPDAADVNMAEPDADEAMPTLGFDFVANGVDWCEQCKRLKQELQQLQEDHALNYNTLKKKIISTDLLIKKFKAKSEDHEFQTKKLEESTKKCEQLQRESETLREQLGSSLQQLEPLKREKLNLEAENRLKDAEIQTLKDRLTSAVSARVQYENLSKSNASFKEKYEESKKEYGKKIQTLESSNQRQEAQIIKLKDDYKLAKSEHTALLKKHRKVEQRLLRAVDKLEKYFLILKTNGMLPKGEKKLRKENYLDLSMTTDDNQSQEEDSLLEEGKKSVKNIEESCDEEDDNISINWTFSPVIHALSPLPPTPVGCPRGDPTDNSDASDDDIAGQLETQFLHSSPIRRSPRKHSIWKQLPEHKKLPVKSLNRCKNKTISKIDFDKNEDRQSIEKTELINTYLSVSKETCNPALVKDFIGNLSESDNEEPKLPRLRTKTFKAKLVKEISPRLEEAEIPKDSAKNTHNNLTENCVLKNSNFKPIIVDENSNSNDSLSLNNGLLVSKRKLSPSKKSHKISVLDSDSDSDTIDLDTTLKANETKSGSSDHKEISNSDMSVTSITDSQKKPASLLTKNYCVQPSVSTRSKSLDLPTKKLKNNSPKKGNSNMNSRYKPIQFVRGEVINPYESEANTRPVTRNLTKSFNILEEDSVSVCDNFTKDKPKSSSASDQIHTDLSVISSGFSGQSDNKNSVKQRLTRNRVKSCSEKSIDTYISPKRLLRSRSEPFDNVTKIDNIIVDNEDKDYDSRNRNNGSKDVNMKDNRCTEMDLKEQEKEKLSFNNPSQRERLENEKTDVSVNVCGKESQIYDNDSHEAIENNAGEMECNSKGGLNGNLDDSGSVICNQGVILDNSGCKNETDIATKNNTLRNEDKSEKRHADDHLCNIPGNNNDKESNVISGEVNDSVWSPRRFTRAMSRQVSTGFVIKSPSSDREVSGKIGGFSKMDKISEENEVSHDIESVVDDKDRLNSGKTEQSNKFVRENIDLMDDKISNIDSDNHREEAPDSENKQLSETENCSTFSGRTLKHSIECSSNLLSQSSDGVSSVSHISEHLLLKEEAERDIHPQELDNVASCSTAVASVASPELAELLPGGSSGATSRSATPTSLSALSPMSPLPMSPFNLVAPLSPLPPSPPRNDHPPLSPLPLDELLTSGALVDVHRLSTSESETNTPVVTPVPFLPSSSPTSDVTKEEVGKAPCSFHATAPSGVLHVKPRNKCLKPAIDKSDDSKDIVDHKSNRRKRKSTEKLHLSEKKTCTADNQTFKPLVSGGITSTSLPITVLEREMKNYLNKTSKVTVEDFVKRLQSKDDINTVSLFLIQWTTQALRCSECDKFAEIYSFTQQEVHGSMKPFYTEQESKLLSLFSYLCQIREWESLNQRLLESLWNAIFLPEIVPVTGRAALCRLFTGISKLQGDVEQVRVMLYNIMTVSYLSYVTLVLSVVSVWPEVLRKSTSDPSPVVTVMEHCIMGKIHNEEKERHKICICFTTLCNWTQPLQTSDSLLKLLLRTLDVETKMEKGNKSNQVLTYELVRSIELLLQVEDLQLFKTTFMQSALNPTMQKWKSKKSETNVQFDLYILRIVGAVLPKKKDLTMKYTNEVLKKQLLPLLNCKYGDMETCTVDVILELSPFSPQIAFNFLYQWYKDKKSSVSECVRNKLQNCRKILLDRVKLQCPPFS